jgi:uncharacterized protein involved in response to NO
VLRREPYRLLFPVGALLGWAGVGHWLLLALGVPGVGWKGPFHALAQVQGFMTCFALGFLFTFIPRRTGTEGPAPWQLGLAALLPVAVTAGAWFEAWRTSQLLFVLLLLLLLGFVLPRVLRPHAGNTVPEGMVWVPVAVGMGLAGALLPWLGMGWPHTLGTGLLTQGLFTALVLGVGGMLLPMFLHGERPQAGAGLERALLQAMHLGAAALFALSFLVEQAASSALGHGVRAFVAAVVLVLPARLWRAPSQPGLHRWLIWLSAWALPLGYALVALRPQWRTAGLHVVFLGCFALMALAVSVHVVLAHGGRPALLHGRPWQVGGLGALVGGAVVARALMAVAPGGYQVWLGLAAGCFLAATLLWAHLLLPALRAPPVPH